MSRDWLFKDDPPATPGMQACIDRTNEAIRKAGLEYQRYLVIAQPSDRPGDGRGDAPAPRLAPQPDEEGGTL